MKREINKFMDEVVMAFFSRPWLWVPSTPHIVMHCSKVTYGDGADLEVPLVLHHSPLGGFFARLKIAPISLQVDVS